MRNSIVLLAAVGLLMIAGVGQADTVTSGTLTHEVDVTQYNTRVDTLDWLSDASGNVVATLTGVRGTIKRIVINPDDGATSPTASYDMTLTDQDGVDLLGGLGANVSASATTDFPSVTTDSASSTTVPRPTVGDLDLAITNAGAANGGIVRVFLRREY